MPMIRAMRMLNAVEMGTTSGAQLQTLLDDPGRLGEWNVLMGMRGQARRMAASSTAMTEVAASSTAMTAVAASSTAMAAVIASSTAMNAVAASSTAMAAVAASSTAMTAVAASSTAMAAVIASSTAMNAVAASSTARAAIGTTGTAYNAIAASNMAIGKYAAGYAALDPSLYADMNAVAASSTAMNAVAASSTAMTAVIASSTAMTEVAASSTAMTAVYASTTAIAAIAPTAWGVYGPHASRITLSGSNVTQWSDASSNARHFVQATDSKRPQFNSTSVVNGYNTLNFVRSSSQVLDTSTTHAMPADITAYIVRRKTTDSTYMGLIGTGSTDDAGAIADSDTAGSVCIDFSGNPASYKIAVGTVVNTWELIRVRNTGSTTWAKKNNGAEASTAANALFGTVTLSIGRMNDANANGDMYLNGQIAEIIILSKNAADGDAEGDRITNMLRTKYALW